LLDADNPNQTLAELAHAVDVVECVAEVD